MNSSFLRQRHNTNLEHQSDQTFANAELVIDDSMLNNFFGTEEEEENYKKQNTLYSRLSHYQQQKQHNNNFNTYPPKKRNLNKLQQHSQRQRNNSQSISNILRTTTLQSKMSSRNSPLRNTNTSSGRFYTKRFTKKSFSESSAEKLQRYTTSDSSTSQEEDDLMMSTSDKRKMTRRSLSSGLQSQNKYQHHLMQHRSQRTSQSLNDDNDDICSIIFGSHSQYVSDMIDIGIRVVLVVVFSKLETQTAFKRIIHSEEMWMYKNPRTKDFVSPLSLLFAVIFGPFLVTLIHLSVTKDRRDFRAASWAWTLILGVNGLFTSLLKISVGRPRPDFYYRCFPDGVMQPTHNSSSSSSSSISGVDNLIDLLNCTGNLRDINEGHKSFPSGHSSFAFAGFGFISYYVGAKLHAFNHRGRGESWRLCISVAPLVVAALVAVSRTCDYHHHWEDVTVGSVIGLFVSYCIYRQYYPSIFSPHCHRAYTRGIGHSTLKAKLEHAANQPRNRRRLQSYKRAQSEECGEASLLCENQADGFSAENDKRPLLSEQKTNNKWF